MATSPSGVLPVAVIGIPSAGVLLVIPVTFLVALIAVLGRAAGAALLAGRFVFRGFVEESAPANAAAAALTVVVVPDVSGTVVAPKAILVVRHRGSRVPGVGHRRWVVILNLV